MARLGADPRVQQVAHFVRERMREPLVRSGLIPGIDYATLLGPAHTDGTPWKGSAIRKRVATLAKLHTRTSADGTYEQLLCADATDAFCDGRTAHCRAAGARAVRGEAFAQTCGADTSSLNLEGGQRTAFAPHTRGKAPQYDPMMRASTTSLTAMRGHAHWLDITTRAGAATRSR
jgi:hypothetical protein